MRFPLRGIQGALRWFRVPALVAVSSSVTSYAAADRGASQRVPQQTTHNWNTVAEQELPKNTHDTSSDRRREITDDYIETHLPKDDNLHERVRNLIWNPKFLRFLGDVFEQHADAKSPDDTNKLASRTAVEKAFDEACLSHVFPLLSTALDRPIRQRVAYLEELKEWMIEIKGDDTFELSKEDFVFLVQRFALVLIYENPPITKRSWIGEIWAIDSPQAFMQIGGLSIFLLILIARSKRLLGK